MLDETWSEYIRLYVTASKKIKARFPNIKVGGPAMSCFNVKQADELLARCKRSRRRSTSSWHVYGNSIDAIVNCPAS